jgi:DNA invertase Pin-like site-specific DNA recombinase
MAKRIDVGNRALCYVRVSTVEQSKFGFSLDAQEQRLRAYCQVTGLEVVELIREEGVSASIPLAKRPAGAKLLEWIGGGIGHVICLKLDRLFRDAEDALRQTKAWDKAGIALHMVDMGGASMNTASAMGRMFLTLMAGCAELERNLVAERTASVLAHKKQQGKVYNHTPYGFERVGDRLVAAADEMAMVRLMRERRDDGWSLAMIADAFNTDHIPGKNGGKWYGRTVKNILENSLYQTVGVVAGEVHRESWPQKEKAA